MNQVILSKKSIVVWLRIATPTLIVFCVHLLAVYLYLYDLHPHFDVVMHLLGGGAVAWSWMLLNRIMLPTVRLPVIYQIIVAVGIVALAATGWEFYEFFFDVRDGAPIRQLSIANTMQDFACGLLGGLVVSAVQLSGDSR